MPPSPSLDPLSARDRWSRVERLFAEALALTSDELRAAYLREQCRENPGLYNELATLLASDSKATHNDFLGEPLGRLGNAFQ